MKISLLTGGGDRPYALGLLSCLLSKNINVDFIGSDELYEPNLMKHTRVVFHNIRGDQRTDASMADKAVRVTRYYVRLIKYAFQTDSNLFHILWLNKFIYFDRTVLNCYYKILGKKIVHTAHNIDQQARDGKSTFLNRLTLRIMYRLMDHIFVHTAKMKHQLINQFKVEDNKISVIPFGINDTVPESMLTKTQARAKLGLSDNDKVILFFGNIAPYKGLENLVEAMPILKKKIGKIKLVIAGRIKGCDSYWSSIKGMIRDTNLEECIIARTEFIPDDQVEIYYKAADAFILPYKRIFQSGVLLLSYNFGLPVIATDVGSLREDILEGKTGFVCPPDDPESLASSIIKFFNSSLYEKMEISRHNIMAYAKKRYSWDNIGDLTIKTYNNLI